jgi:CubicO group peptidase (beta-lactamase class C family)
MKERRTQRNSVRESERKSTEWVCAKVLTLMLGVVLVLVVLGIAQVPATAADERGANTPDFSAIDRYVEEEMEADRVPGLALAIVRGDEVVHLRGFGTTGPDGRPVTPQTSFVLGSMSKSFTALAIMQLAEKGKVELDAPVQRYVPWFRVASPEASARITVRHLLNQTSGLPENASRAGGAHSTLEAHVRALRDVELTHPPGATYEYSSPNYQVLGLIVQEVSGQPFGEYVRHNIFDPLKMDDSFTSQIEAQEGGTMANGHRYWFGRPVAADLPYEEGRLPSASLISSSEDMARYLIAQLNEGRYEQSAVVSPDGMAELHRPAAESGEGYSYAMGWRVGPIDGVPAIHHGGTLPHFRGKMVLLPEEGWGVVVLTNASSFVGSPTSHRVADEVAGMLVGQGSDETSLGVGRLYLLITLGMLLITFNQVKGIFTLWRWRAQLAGQAAEGHALLRRVALPVALEIAWPLLFLIGLPRFLGIPWSALVLFWPDVGYWAILVALVGLGVGLLKAALAFAALRRGADALAARITRHALAK